MVKKQVQWARLDIRVTAAQKKAIRAAAKRKGVTVSTLVRDATTKAIGR